MDRPVPPLDLAEALSSSALGPLSSTTGTASPPRSCQRATARRGYYYCFRSNNMPRLKPPNAWCVGLVSRRDAKARSSSASWPHGSIAMPPSRPRSRQGSTRSRHALAPQRATHRHRWGDHGTTRLALGVTHALELRTYLVDPLRRDANGHLLLDDGSSAVFPGYSNYRAIIHQASYSMPRSPLAILKRRDRLETTTLAHACRERDI